MTWIVRNIKQGNDIIHFHRSAFLACAVLNDHQGILHLGDLGSHSKSLPEHYWENVGRLPWQTPPVLHIARRCSMILCYPRKAMKYITETSRKNTVELCQGAQMISVPSLVRRRMFASSLSWGGPWGYRGSAYQSAAGCVLWSHPMICTEIIDIIGCETERPFDRKVTRPGDLHPSCLPQFPQLPFTSTESFTINSCGFIYLHALQCHEISFPDPQIGMNAMFWAFPCPIPGDHAVSHHQDTAGEVRRPLDGEILRESGPISAYDW